MKSAVTRDFRSLFAALPSHVQSRARTAYGLWKNDPGHPGLQFKRVHPSEAIYSARVGIGWRALGVVDGDVIIWFWIGSHGDYDRMLRRL